MDIYIYADSVLTSTFRLGGKIASPAITWSTSYCLWFWTLCT